MRPAHLAHERRGADLFVAARQSPAVPRVEHWHSINLGTLAYHSAGKPRPAAPADPNSMNKTHYRLCINALSTMRSLTVQGGSLSTGRFSL